MKTRTFFLLLLLVVLTWSCKKEQVTASSQPISSPASLASSSISQPDSSAANQAPLLNTPADNDFFRRNGYFVIKAMTRPELKLVLDLPSGSKQDGVIIQQYPYHGGGNQYWRVIDLQNGYYAIQSYSSNKYLDVPNGSLAPGVKIQQYTWHGGPNQQWRISHTLGVGQIYNRATGLALVIPNGSPNPGVQIQQSFTFGGGQTWKFVSVSWLYDDFK